MASVLLVSKPVVPPWNDSSKNLARDVAEGMRRHAPRVFSRPGATWRPSRGSIEMLGNGRTGFAPSFASQLGVVRHLAFGARAAIWHFFFAPNPRTSTVARGLSRLRRVPTVQSICSRPRDLSRVARLLFADRNVALSRATEDALRDAGAAGVVRIAPAVPPLESPTAEARARERERFDVPTDAPLIVYPGDLEHGDGARRILDAHARLRSEATLAMACRAKTPAARDAERDLRSRAAARVVWIGETPDIHSLLGAADVVALPSSDLYAKMDLPLVLIEAMWLERAVIVAEGAPASELAPGVITVEPQVDALAAAIDALLDDDGARRAQGRTARRIAEERYHPRAMVDAYESLYDALLREPR